MKILKYFTPVILLALIAVGCKKDQFGDLSFVSTASSSSNVAVMFNITHDNTGVVTITPSGAGASSYDITFGDGTTTPVTVQAGQSTTHTYAEGNYSVKVTSHDLKGGATSVTQPLVVSFLAPQNLKVKLSTSGLSLSVSASAQYATYFKAYFGDSLTVTPIPSTSFLPGQTITHTFPGAGTYYGKVIAYSGGSKTAEFLDTVKVGKQIDLPVTFDDPNTDYTTSDFGNNSSSIAVDPTSASNHVLKVIKNNGAEVWAGTTVGTSLGFKTLIPVTASASKLSAMVYSPAAGLHIRLKLEDHTDGTHSVETEALTTGANKWETLTFDFNNQATGTAALNSTYKYDKASVFFDFGNAGKGSIFYFDNLMVAAAPVALKQIDLPVTFDDATVDYTATDFGGNNSAVATDPKSASNHVLKAIKTAGAEVWAGTTIGTPTGFKTLIPVTSSSSKMTAMVYSPAAGLHIRLKLEDHNDGTHSVETEALSTVANQWETLTWDFNNQASGTSALNASYHYDKASVFFDFGNAGTGSTFYFDNLMMASGSNPPPGGGLSQISLPVTFDSSTVDYSVTDFGNNSSTLVVDPVNSGNHVIKTIKKAGAETWAGTTIGTGGKGFPVNVPFTASATKMTVRVYSPAAGLHIRLKVEDHTNNTHTVETEALTTVANQWETLTFDFSNVAAGTAALNLSYNLDMASIFFDFGNAGTGSVFYWDDVKFGN